MKKIISIGITSLLVFSIITTSYAASTTLQNEQSQVKGQINEANEQLNKVQNDKKSTLSEIGDLDNQISKSEAEIAEYQGKIDDLNNDIEKLQEELNKAQEEYNKQQELLQSRLVAQYKAGNVTYLDVLLSSSNITEFISNYYLISEITKYDTELLQNIEVQKQKIQNAKSELEGKNAELKSAKSAKEKAFIVLSNSKKQKQDKYGCLSEQEKSIQSVLDSKNDELRKIDSEIKAAERMASKNSSGSTAYVHYTGGTMAWPTRNAKRVNSVYAPGGRSDTGAYLGSPHKGLDINAPAGTPIYAAAAGTVVYVNKSGYGGGWGLYVVISHGDGIYTRYAHGSSIPGNIEVGASVDTNTCIMYSGSTGAAEGAHLHFEVCRNSIYNQVNPCDYLGVENRVGNIG